MLDLPIHHLTLFVVSSVPKKEFRRWFVQLISTMVLKFCFVSDPIWGISTKQNEGKKIYPMLAYLSVVSLSHSIFVLHMIFKKKKNVHKTSLPFTFESFKEREKWERERAEKYHSMILLLSFLSITKSDEQFTKEKQRKKL